MSFRIFRYALLGFPLGFIGLPIYVLLPKYYSDNLSVSLSVIGGFLFATRILDCLLDPWIGYICDRMPRQRNAIMALAGLFISTGVFGLFALPLYPGYFLFLFPVLLSVTYISYSVLMINYYAAGLAHSQTYNQSTRVSSAREIAVVMGVLVATSLPYLLMQYFGQKYAYICFSLIFIFILAICGACSAHTLKFSQENYPPQMVGKLLQNKELRWVLFIFFLNGVPTSITATLFSFYTADMLHASNSSGAFLAGYFLAAALAMPVWSALSRRIGKRNSLLQSMLLAILSFIWVYFVDEGNSVMFSVICIASGIALGGDLVILPALVADTLRGHNAQGGLEFGIWNFINKFNLATAAGIALPTLTWLGYKPGSADGNSLQVLVISYAVLPCAFKLLAIIALYFSPIKNPKRLK